jgi:hypothetical protein
MEEVSMSVVSNTISLPLLPLVSGILGNLLNEGREDGRSREEREEKWGGEGTRRGTVRDVTGEMKMGRGVDGGDEERDGTGNEEVRSREEKDVVWTGEGELLSVE